MSTIGERIRRRRIELEISQETLASLLGYKNRTSITKIESDARSLTQQKIKQIAEALKTTPEYIMGWDDPEHLQWDAEIRIQAIKALAFGEADEKSLVPGAYDPNKPFDAALFKVFSELSDLELSDEENSLLTYYRSATPEAQKSAFMVLRANQKEASQ